MFENLYRHPFEETVLWSDSKVTLFWITQYKPRNTTFVNNRVLKIRELSKPEWWHYCPSEHNPADLATKTTIKDPLSKDSIWWMGPIWITKHHFYWDDDRDFQTYSQDDDNDITTAVHHIESKADDSSYLVDEVNYQQFHNLDELLQHTVNIVMDDPAFNCKNHTDLELKKKAEVLWIARVQKEYYREEISSLKKRRSVDHISPLRKLRPQLDKDGLLRLSTRFNNGEFDDDWMRPYILPKNHYFTTLIVQHYHIKLLHAGLSTTLLNLRHRFWIISARNLVKKVIHNCVICARFANRRFDQPQPPLPPFRTANVLPFSNVGMDMAGPIYLYNNDSAIKGYIVLFTCATTRAVHLELTLSLRAEDIILAIKRFTSRRGLPHIIYSDNATSFKSADNIIMNEYHITDLYKIQNHLEIQNNIEWHNIVEKAPWWGGYWERLIRSIKDPIRKVLGKTLMDVTHFYTLLCEVESVINSRPLTIMYDEHEDWTPVTPSELIIGRNIQQLEPNNNLNISINEVVRVRSKFFQQFIFAWQKSYLSQLRTCHQYEENKEVPVQLGDIVLIDESPHKSQLWPLAKVIELLPGQDGRVRACVVETDDKHTFKRPIQLLVKLPKMDRDVATSSVLPGSVKDCDVTKQGDNKTSNQ